MNVLMHATIANPGYILRAGRVYDMPRKLASTVCALTVVGNVTVDKKDEIHVTSGGPAAVPYDERRHGKRPALRVPSQPDPEDRADISDEDDFAAMEETE